MYSLRNKLRLVFSTGLYIMQVEYCNLYSLTLECQSGGICCVRGLQPPGGVKTMLLRVGCLLGSNK